MLAWDLFRRLRIALGIRLLAKMAGKLRSEGFGGLPSGPWILACPFSSFYDPALLDVSSPRLLHFLPQPGADRPPLGAWLLRHEPRALPKLASMESSTFHHALHLLRQENIVVVFFNDDAAGGETEDPSIASVSSLAQISGIPVRPCLVTGSRALAEWRMFKKRPLLRLQIGEPFSSYPDLPPKAARTELERHLREVLTQLRQKATEAHPSGS